MQVKAAVRYTLHIYLACSGTCSGQLAYLLGLLLYLLWSSSKASHFFVKGQHNTCSKAQMYMALVNFYLKASRKSDPEQFVLTLLISNQIQPILRNFRANFDQNSSDILSVDISSYTSSTNVIHQYELSKQLYLFFFKNMHTLKHNIQCVVYPRANELP